MTPTLWLAASEQAQLTRTAAEAARSSAEALPIWERAYVFVGIELRPEIIVGLEHRIASATAILNVLNHGKTPAFVSEISLGFSIVENRETMPPYPQSFIDDEIAIPSGGTYGAEARPRARSIPGS